MRRLAGLLAACAMVAASLPASAVAEVTPVHVTQRSPFTATVENPCNGENVVLSGQSFADVTIVRTPSGFNISAHQALILQGEGDFGNHYSTSDVTNITFRTDSGLNSTLDANTT